MARGDQARPSWGLWLELTCRAGYAARGVVYLSVGLIALLAAVDILPTPRGVLPALQAWAAWPLGAPLLWLIGLGLYAFAGWRALQALFDADRQGTGPRALAARAGQAISGLVYFGLAIGVFGLIDTFEDLREFDEQAQTRQTIESLMAMPGGEILVMVAGLFVIGCGAGGLIQAAGRDFCKRLDCTARVGRHAVLLGRFGYAARGLVFFPVGASLIFAGLHSRSSEAKGAGAALAGLEHVPMGDGVLMVVALGLMAFGLFAMVEAGWRTLVMPGAAVRPGQVLGPPIAAAEEVSVSG